MSNTYMWDRPNQLIQLLVLIHLIVQFVRVKKTLHVVAYHNF